jgi:hypothetical protein
MSISPRRAGYFAGALAIVVGAWLGLDELIVTEEERLEAFANDVTGPVEPARIDAALATWTDPATQPVELRGFGRSEVYGAEHAAELASRAREALRTYGGERLRKMRQGIEVRDDEASVSLRIVSGRGMVDVDFGLRKHGDRWLVSDVDVHR